MSKSVIFTTRRKNPNFKTSKKTSFARKITCAGPRRTPAWHRGWHRVFSCKNHVFLTFFLEVFLFFKYFFKNIFKFFEIFRQFFTKMTFFENPKTVIFTPTRKKNKFWNAYKTVFFSKNTCAHRGVCRGCTHPRCISTPAGYFRVKITRF